MNCPKCSYVMDAFDSVCPRCQGKGINPPPSPAIILPVSPIVNPPSAPNASKLKWNSINIALGAAVLFVGYALISPRSVTRQNNNSNPNTTSSPTPVAPAPTSVPVSNISPIVVDTPLPAPPSAAISKPTPKPIVFTKLNQRDLSEQLIDRWGSKILEAKSAKELDVIQTYLLAAKAGMEEARPENVSPERWKYITQDYYMQSAIYQLGKAADERMRIFNGADIMGRSDSTAAQMINTTKTFIHQTMAPPEEQKQQQEDMVEAVRRNTAKATWRE